MGAPGTITKPVNSAETCAYDPAQVTIVDGLLTLTAEDGPVVATNGQTYAYKSGLVHTAGKVEFVPDEKGIILEAFVNLPAVGTKIANWPAVWLNGHHKKWPDHGELDIMEGLSGDAAWHYHSPSDNIGQHVPGDFTGWHTFACEWYPDHINFWYDGVQVGTVTGGVLVDPMYIILNHGMSAEGHYGGPVSVPAVMEVDYVSVWKRL